MIYAAIISAALAVIVVAIIEDRRSARAKATTDQLAAALSRANAAEQGRLDAQKELAGAKLQLAQRDDTIARMKAAMAEAERRCAAAELELQKLRTPAQDFAALGGGKA